MGNEQTLLASNSIWEALVLDAKDRQCFFHADDDTDMRKTILDVNKELDQLDDLLNGDSILFKEKRWKVHTFINFSCFCYIDKWTSSYFGLLHKMGIVTMQLLISCYSVLNV